MSLNHEDIEKALLDIESPTADRCSKSCGPFSVFRSRPASERPVPTLAHPVISPNEIDSDVNSSQIDNCHQPNLIDLAESGRSNDDPLHEAGHAHGQSESMQTTSHSDEALARYSPIPHMEIEFQNMSYIPDTSPNPSEIHSEGLDTSFSPQDIRCKDEFLTTEMKFMLRHYANTVLPIFSPLEIPDNLWREHHLSTALQCSIEMEILGDSSPFKKTLLYAVLTISAYNLRNTVLLHHRSSWNRLASHYKGETLKLLESCVAGSSSRLPEEAYSDLLAAMLAMVTIDVSFHFYIQENSKVDFE